MAIIVRECKVNNTQLGVNDALMYQSIKAMFDRQGVTPDAAAKVWLKDDNLSNTSCVYVYTEEKELGGDVHSVPTGFAQEVTWQTVLDYVEPIFHHKFDGTVGQAPSSTDETGKNVTFNSCVVADSSPAPSVGTGYLSHSLSTDGSGVTDYLADFNFGTGKFKIQFKLYLLSNVNSDVISIEENSESVYGPSLIGITGNKLKYQWYTPGQNISLVESSALPLNEWVDVKFGYDGTSHLLYINDVLQGSYSSPVTAQSFNASMSFYARGGVSPESYIDDLMVYKGSF